MPALAAISTIAGLLLNAYSQQQSAKATGEAQGRLNKRISDLDAWYSTESAKDYTQTEEGQSSMKRLESQMKKALESQTGSAVRTGATPESQVALKGELQEKYGEAVSRLSGLSTQRKEGVRRDYTSQMNQLLNKQEAFGEQEQSSWANLSSNIGSALGSLSSADTGSGGEWDWLNNLFSGGGSNVEVGVA